MVGSILVFGSGGSQTITASWTVVARRVTARVVDREGFNEDVSSRLGRIMETLMFSETDSARKPYQ